MKQPRKRAIERASKELERYENWKESVLVVGGSLRKDEKGKCYGVMSIGN